MENNLWIILGLLCFITPNIITVLDLKKTPTNDLFVFFSVVEKSTLLLLVYLGSHCPIKEETRACKQKSRGFAAHLSEGFENTSFWQVKGFTAKTNLIPGRVIAVKMLRNCQLCLLKCIYFLLCSSHSGTHKGICQHSSLCCHIVQYRFE